MPKKFQGENTKAVVAKVRKAEKAAAEKAHKEKVAEDEYWKEDNKLICKKLQRKDERERRKQEDIQKRQEKKHLEENEEIEIAPKSQPQKVTAYQILKRKDEAELTSKKEAAEADECHLDAPLFENLNLSLDDQISASGIDAAVAALSMNNSTQDRHPERRMAAAYRAFEEERMPQLKKENQSMRLSQLKQLLKKEWQRSPQNPLNQQTIAYNAK